MGANPDFAICAWVPSVEQSATKFRHSACLGPTFANDLAQGVVAYNLYFL